MSTEICYVAALEVNVPARRAFDYLADGIRQGEWTLGSWNREQLTADLFRGRSLFDGSFTYVRITPDLATLTVDYEIGASPKTLLRLNSARVVPGAAVGRRDEACIISLLKYRGLGQSDTDWERLCAAFATEIHMIKGRLEHEF